jgi:hypothetical protein
LLLQEWNNIDQNVILCAVQNVYQRYEETGLITRRPGSGRKRITIQRDDRFLVSTSLPNRTASAVFLVFILNGSLTGHRYITEVLEDHVMPFMITMGEHGILMHDNARPHAAVLSEDIRMRSELGDLIGQHSVQT